MASAATSWSTRPRPRKSNPLRIRDHIALRRGRAPRIPSRFQRFSQAAGGLAPRRFCFCTLPVPPRDARDLAGGAPNVARCFSTSRSTLHPPHLHSHASPSRHARLVALKGRPTPTHASAPPSSWRCSPEQLSEPPARDQQAPPPTLPTAISRRTSSRIRPLADSISGSPHSGRPASALRTWRCSPEQRFSRREQHAAPPPTTVPPSFPSLPSVVRIRPTKDVTQYVTSSKIPNTARHLYSRRASSALLSVTESA